MQTRVLDRIHPNMTFSVSCCFSSQLSISSTPGGVSVPSCRPEHRELHLTSDPHNRVSLRRNLEKSWHYPRSAIKHTAFQRTTQAWKQQAGPRVPGQPMLSSPGSTGPRRQPSCWNHRRSMGQNSPRTCRSVSSRSPPPAQRADLNADRGSYLKEFEDQ